MSGQKISSLKRRILSGVVLAPLVVAAIVLGGWFFMAMIFPAILLSLYEWCRLAEKGKAPYLFMVMGGIYLSICFCAFVFIRFAYDQGAWLALMIILCVWASDIGAYFTGKKLGGPKMAPKISPKKTWAGLGGAMFFCGLTLVALLFAGESLHEILPTDIPYKTSHILHIIYIFVTGLVLGVVGQCGDLLISMLKRRVDAKDTGDLIPGHGGLLDRIDALLLVSPAFLLIYEVGTLL